MSELTCSRLIKIAVDECGNFCYSPSVARLLPGETVSWICDDGPFTIMFKDKTPFELTDPDGKRIASLDAFARRGEASIPQMVSGNSRGHFSYAVAVAAGDRVFLDANCPELVVN